MEQPPTQAVRGEIEREAEDHIALGMLLRKDRDQRKKTAVEKVLASDLAVPEKIDKIKEIDQKEDALAILSIIRQVGDQAPRGRVGKVGRNIKRTLRSLPHLAFLFREYGRVQAFGRKTHVLEARILPPGVRMDSYLASFLAKEVQPSAVELSGRLRSVVEHGWRYLTARQYNLLVLLKRLADRLQAFDFLRMNWRDVNLIDGLRRIETLFLMLHYQPDTVESILDALRVFFERQHQNEEEIVRTNSLVLEILAEDFALPSLYNCIVGLNILKYRRTLTLGDLMREGLGEVVDSRSFDCEDHIRAHMDSYIDDTLQSIKTIHEQLQEARRINSFASVDDQGKVDTSVLRRMYESLDPREMVSFDGDQGNLVLFLSRLMRGFDKVFSPLLNGSCTLEGGTRVTLFPRSFFETDFSRLKSVAERLDNGPFHFSNFPVARYLQIKTARMGTVGSEMEGSQLVLEGVGCLVDIGKALVKVISAQSSAEAAGLHDGSQPMVLQGKAFALPSDKGRLQGHSFLNGKTVIEALSMAVSICFTAGLLFQDDFLALFLGKEKKLALDLHARMRQMENLLEPESYESLSSLYA